MSNIKKPPVAPKKLSGTHESDLFTAYHIPGAATDYRDKRQTARLDPLIATIAAAKRRDAAKLTPEEAEYADRHLKQDLFKVPYLWAKEFNHSLRKATIMGKICHVFDNFESTLVERSGFRWVVKKAALWAAELVCSERQVGSLLAELDAEGYLIKEVHRHGPKATPTVFLRPDMVKVMAVRSRHQGGSNYEYEQACRLLLSGPDAGKMQVVMDAARDRVIERGATVSYGVLDAVAEILRENRAAMKIKRPTRLNKRPVNDDLKRREEAAAIAIKSGRFRISLKHIGKRKAASKKVRDFGDTGPLAKLSPEGRDFVLAEALLVELDEKNLTPPELDAAFKAVGNADQNIPDGPEETFLDRCNKARDDAAAAFVAVAKKVREEMMASLLSENDQKSHKDEAANDLGDFSSCKNPDSEVSSESHSEVPSESYKSLKEDKGKDTPSSSPSLSSITQSPSSVRNEDKVLSQGASTLPSSFSGQEKAPDPGLAQCLELLTELRKRNHVLGETAYHSVVPSFREPGLWFKAGGQVDFDPLIDDYRHRGRFLVRVSGGHAWLLRDTLLGVIPETATLDASKAEMRKKADLRR